MKRSTMIVCIASMLASACAQREDSPTNFYEISTPQGVMVIRLYDETPGHRDNFRKLVADGVLDSTLFHRIIPTFMVQGGDPNSKDGDPFNDGAGGPGYTVPAEINDQFFHKRGALAAARQSDQFNPNRESSGSQFYIVHGRVWSEPDLAMMEAQSNGALTIPPERREYYTRYPGYPPLDGQYTVFGELVEGFEVLDAIANVPTSGRFGRPPNRPATDIPMAVRPLPNYKQ